MSDPKPASSKAEAMAKKLQSTLAQRRPRRWKALLATAALALVLMLIPAYWIFFPRQPKAPLLVVALDTLCLPDETIRIEAQLYVSKDGDAPALRGETVVFVEQKLPGEKPRELVASTDAQGRATCAWPIAPATGEFLARYVNATDKKGTSDRGRVHVWPAESRLVIVDADETLAGDAVDEQAIACLINASKEDWRVVYLTFVGATPRDFRAARDWIDRQTKLPRGPVLGRCTFHDAATVDSLRRDILRSLGKFTGKHVAIVKSDAAARVTREAGFRTIQLGVADTPTWEAAAKQMRD